MVIGLSNRPSHEVDIFPISLYQSEKPFVYGEFIFFLICLNDCIKETQQGQLRWGTGMWGIRISTVFFLRVQAESYWKLPLYFMIEESEYRAVLQYHKAIKKEYNKRF